MAYENISKVEGKDIVVEEIEVTNPDKTKSTKIVAFTKEQVIADGERLEQGYLSAKSRNEAMKALLGIV